MIAKLEVITQGRNPRFIVTNLNGNAQQLYDQVYCARGEMENRIKEQSNWACSPIAPAPISGGPISSAYCIQSGLCVLMETIRRLALHDKELARAQVGTLRLKLFKASTVVLRNMLRIRFLLSSAFSY